MPNGLATASAWLTTTNYTVGTTVYQNFVLYRCLVAHTSGVFATDLAAAKWLLLTSLPIAANGTNGTNAPTYGGSSTTSFLIGTGSKAFTTQSTLAYLVGNYVRASSAANGANFMEGLVTAYTGTTLTINITKTGGSGTLADWNFSVSGAPGLGDLVSTNNLSDVSNAGTARTNLGLAIGTNVQAFDAQLFSNIPQNSQSAAYGIVATDAQKHIFHPSADTTARTWTIPANASVAFPIGTALTFVN